MKVENIFKAACEYKLVVEEPAGDIRPYPQCDDSNWGPGAPVRQYGLIPSNHAAILSAPNGRAEMYFKRNNQVRLFAKLVRDGFAEDVLENCVDTREQDDLVWVCVELQAPGEYGLEIYANDPDQDGDRFTHMCQYLVSYTDRDLGTQYGQVFDRLDLGYSMQAQPERWQGGTSGSYGSLPRGERRMPPPKPNQYGGSQSSLTGNL